MYRNSLGHSLLDRIHLGLALLCNTRASVQRNALGRGPLPVRRNAEPVLASRRDAGNAELL